MSDSESKEMDDNAKEASIDSKESEKRAKFNDAEE